MEHDKVRKENMSPGTVPASVARMVNTYSPVVSLSREPLTVTSPLTGSTTNFPSPPLVTLDILQYIKIFSLKANEISLVL